MQFREIYKQRVVEAVLGRGRERPFYAFVDGHAADHYIRYGGDAITTSFGSRTAALAAARNAVDADIAYQSYLRHHHPEQAVERAEKMHKRAIEALARLRAMAEGKSRIWVVPDRSVDPLERLADVEMRIRRTKADLDLAKRALPVPCTTEESQ